MKEITYYIEINGEIKTFNKDINNIKNLMLYRKELAGKEIKATEEEIISFQGRNVFKKDVLEEYFKEQKVNRLDNLDMNCKSFIYSKYSVETQLNITNGIKEGQEEMKEFINKARGQYKQKKKELEACKNEEELNKVNIEFEE